jgi:hypothetical protein
MWAPVRRRDFASLFVTYARENRSFEQLGVWSRGTENVTDDVVPEEVTTLNITAGALRGLGIQPAVGRWFSEEDHAPGSRETVILIDGYWRRRFGQTRRSSAATSLSTRARDW